MESDICRGRVILIEKDMGRGVLIRARIIAPPAPLIDGYIVVKLIVMDACSCVSLPDLRILRIVHKHIIMNINILSGSGIALNGKGHIIYIADDVI